MISKPALRERTQAMSDELISRIAETFADRVSNERCSGRWHKRLRMKNGPIISVLERRDFDRRFNLDSRVSILFEIGLPHHISRAGIIRRDESGIKRFVLPKVDFRGRLSHSDRFDALHRAGKLDPAFWQQGKHNHQLLFLHLSPVAFVLRLILPLLVPITCLQLRNSINQRHRRPRYIPQLSSALQT
jgi:hypothetical protein